MKQITLVVTLNVTDEHLLNTEAAMLMDHAYGSGRGPQLFAEANLAERAYQAIFECGGADLDRMGLESVCRVTMMGGNCGTQGNR